MNADWNTALGCLEELVQLCVCVQEKEKELPK